MRHHLSWRIGAVVLAASLGLAACGGDEDDVAASDETTKTTAGSETTDAPAPTGEPILIGTMIWNIPAADLGRRVPGIQGAVDAINESGGINGRPLEWILCEAGDPNQGEQCARDFVSRGVVATVSDANMIAEASSAEILRVAGIPQIDPFVSVPEALSSENVYMLTAPPGIQFAAIVQFMDIVGKERLHVLAGAVSTAEPNVEATRRAAEYFGIEVDGRTDIPLTAADYTPMVAAANDVGADTNVAIIGPFMTDLLLQAATQLGAPLNIGISESQFNQQQYETYAQPGGPLDGALMVESIPPIHTADEHPELARALDEIAAYVEESGDERGAPERLTSTVIRAWLSVQAFAAVVADLEEVTAATVTEALETVEDVELGLIPPWTPSHEGPPGFEAVSNPYQYLMTVENGEVVLYQEEPIDATLPFRE